MNKRFYLTAIICVIYLTAHSQIDTTFNKEDITFMEYMDLVRSHNLQYAAEKFNVRISEAAIEAAKVFPDPYISFDVARSREAGIVTGHGYSSDVGTTIELGGKRRARIDLARSEDDLSRALLADYFRNLQAEAALAYLESMKQKQLLLVGLDSYQTMKQLSEADSIRFYLGSIMQIDAVQSKLEAGILLNELILSATEWKNSLARITFITGLSKSDTLFNPVSNLEDTCRIFFLEDLIGIAQNNRQDLVAAMHNREVSEKALRLARKERIMDIDIRMGASGSVPIDGLTPRGNEITGGLEIPLKFSNISKGQIKMAQARISQSEELYNLAELQIRNEITQAWNQYYAYCKQVTSFDEGLLEMASKVLKGKIYSYQRGETSLLEVLNAQRTFNDVRKAYFEALYNRAVALVNLEKSAGIWDIDF